MIRTCVVYGAGPNLLKDYGIKIRYLLYIKQIIILHGKYTTEKECIKNFNAFLKSKIAENASITDYRT